ncbi:MAG: hypothetical protein AAF203_02740, partial [Pseudomonadota bacterium]
IELGKLDSLFVVDFMIKTVIKEKIAQAIVGFFDLEDTHRFLMAPSQRGVFSLFIRAPIGRVFMRHATAESVEYIDKSTKYGGHVSRKISKDQRRGGKSDSGCQIQ